MRTIGLRTSTAALVVGVVLAFPAGLLLAAAPATAAPDRTAGEHGVGPSLIDAFTAWLVALWPGAEAAVHPQNGIDLDPNGGSAAEPRHGIDLDPNGGATVEPQHGGDLDPDG